MSGLLLLLMEWRCWWWSRAADEERSGCASLTAPDLRPGSIGPCVCDNYGAVELDVVAKYLEVGSEEPTGGGGSVRMTPISEDASDFQGEVELLVVSLQ